MLALRAENFVNLLRFFANHQRGAIYSCEINFIQTSNTRKRHVAHSFGERFSKVDSRRIERHPLRFMNGDRVSQAKWNLRNRGSLFVAIAKLPSFGCHLNSFAVSKLDSRIFSQRVKVDDFANRAINILPILRIFHRHHQSSLFQAQKLRRKHRFLKCCDVIFRASCGLSEEKLFFFELI